VPRRSRNLDRMVSKNIGGREQRNSGVDLGRAGYGSCGRKGHSHKRDGGRVNPGVDPEQIDSRNCGRKSHSHMSDCELVNPSVDPGRVGYGKCGRKRRSHRCDCVLVNPRNADLGHFGCRRCGCKDRNQRGDVLNQGVGRGLVWCRTSGYIPCRMACFENL